VDEQYRNVVRELDLDDIAGPRFRRLVRLARAEGLLSGILAADSFEPCKIKIERRGPDSWHMEIEIGAAKLECRSASATTFAGVLEAVREAYHAVPRHADGKD
jgi:hypothetical protein